MFENYSKREDNGSYENFHELLTPLQHLSSLLLPFLHQMKDYLVEISAKLSYSSYQRLRLIESYLLSTLQHLMLVKAIDAFLMIVTISYSVNYVW